MSKAERNKLLDQMAVEAGFLTWDQADARAQISMALDMIADEGTSVDSGVGADGMDFHVMIGGKEFYINARHSNYQLTLDRQKPGRGKAR